MFLLVFFSTFPIVVPLVVVRNTQAALRVSERRGRVDDVHPGVVLGRYAGRPGWRSGTGVVLVGLLLVAITMALGG